MFSVGDLVVHPMHGAGVIDAIVQEKVAGSTQDYYVFKMPVGGLLLKIPTANSQTIGVRSVIQRPEAEALIAGDDTPLCRQDTPAARRLWAAFRREWRRPAVLIDYERTAWALDFERVRLTIDEHVRAAKSSALFDPAVPMLGLHSGAMTILEVKYDRFLPGHLRAALSSFCAQPMSISKYAIAREMLY